METVRSSETYKQVSIKQTLGLLLIQNESRAFFRNVVKFLSDEPSSMNLSVLQNADYFLSS
jgi:hypothetical protein